MLAIINVAAWMFIRPAAIPTVFSSISGILFLLVLNFFRSPHRNFHGNRERVVVSSADGTVVALEKVFEPEYLNREAIQLSVFMSVLNVHANWYPVDGEVQPKSSTENERSTVVIHTPEGHDVLVRQVAGAIARRIVTYAEPGEQADIEDHMGFIKFGSRVDIYLPLDTEIYAKIGDKTTGGITEVARLAPRKQ